MSPTLEISRHLCPCTREDGSLVLSANDRLHTYVHLQEKQAVADAAKQGALANAVKALHVHLQEKQTVADAAKALQEKTAVADAAKALQEKTAVADAAKALQEKNAEADAAKALEAAKTTQVPDAQKIAELTRSNTELQQEVEKLRGAASSMTKVANEDRLKALQKNLTSEEHRSNAYMWRAKDLAKELATVNRTMSNLQSDITALKKKVQYTPFLCFC